MYSVIRFSGERTKEFFESLENRIEAVTGLGVDNSEIDEEGFSFSISTKADIKSHLKAISSFLAASEAILIEIESFGIKLHVDIAIEPDDLGKKPLLCYFFPSEFLADLCKHRVSLECSIYNPNAK